MVNSPVESGLIEIRVRYGEVDRMSVVHHAKYWNYFEMGRTELLRSRGTAYSDLEGRGIFLVVAACEARYHAPARYDDVLVLSTRQVKTGRARIDHAYELKRKSNGELIATATTTLACVDGEGRVTSLPDCLRQQQ